MLIIILLLVAILIVIIGGPLALGFAIVVPAWLVWTSGILQFMFWTLVASAGFFVVAMLAMALTSRSRTLPANTVEAGPDARFKCTKCGAERDPAFGQCFKCSTFKMAG